MFLKKSKFINNGSRNRLQVRKPNIKSFKHLISRKNRSQGRNNFGKIVCRHKGGGNKFLYRRVDYNLINLKLTGRLVSIDFDNFRTGWLGVIKYTNGIYKFVLLAHNFNIGSILQVGKKNTKLTVGHRTQIKNIPIGEKVYNIETQPFRGGKLVRAAGCFGKVLKVGSVYKLLLPSKAIITVSKNTFCNIGQVSNIYHNLEKYGKAGLMSLKNKRPTVSGSSMNACDHPQGGRTGVRVRVKTPWGKIIKK